MADLQSIDGGSRSRTRRAILDAAMSVLAEHPTASLGDIAAAAKVGRSTLHRYFAERSDLLRALALHVHALSIAAIERAEPDCGPPVEALRRVVECQLDLGPIVPFVYSNPNLAADKQLAAVLDTGDEVIVDWDLQCPCGQASVAFEPGIMRYSEKQGVEDDRITCAATHEVHNEAVNFMKGIEL